MLQPQTLSIERGSTNFCNSKLNYLGDKIVVSLRTGDNGEADVYQYINDEWSRLGSKFEGNNRERLGISLDISASGERIILGADDYSNSSGRAVVYELVENEWVQKIDSFVGGQTGEGLGWVISMSGDGNFFATVSPRFKDDQGYNVQKVNLRKIP